jgi:hypothetical protein
MTLKIRTLVWALEGGEAVEFGTDVGHAPGNHHASDL